MLQEQFTTQEPSEKLKKSLADFLQRKNFSELIIRAVLQESHSYFNRREYMRYLKIDAVREGYEPDQCSDTMTVRELRSLLTYFDDDLPIYLSHDNGYTYGPITEGMIDTAHYDDEDDDSEDED